MCSGIEQQSFVHLKTWQTLTDRSSVALVREAAGIVPGDVAGVARLRKTCPDAETARVALQLAEARRKAEIKFGERAATLWADPQGVEMASSPRAARHKAARFAAVFPGGRVLDLCCGIGGDAMALIEAGLRVAAVDLDPVRAWMAGMNAGCEYVCGDAADVGLWSDGVSAFHIDPARRTEDGGKRLFRLGDLRPGVDVLRGIVERCRIRAGDNYIWGGAIKLGPGVDAKELGTIADGELEIISESGRLTQAVLWVGALASGGTGMHTATLLDSSGTTSMTGTPDAVAPPVGSISRHVFEIDDSVERAVLLSTLCQRLNAPMLHSKLGLLTADAMISHPLLTPFEVLDAMPWNSRRVKEKLTALGAGIVEIKTRDGVVNPDQVQLDLRGRGESPLTVFVLRFDRELRAIIARRVPRAQAITDPPQ